jgi:hypothetical protein
MKINSNESGRNSTSPKPKSFSENKVTKKAADALMQEEMQELLAKLKDLVPNMPKNKKLSKLKIIQYVIDYIFDLQTALESHPAAAGLQNNNNCINNNRSHLNHNSSSPTSQMITSSNSSSPVVSSRQPLSTISICLTGEAL